MLKYNKMKISMKTVQSQLCSIHGERDTVTLLEGMSPKLQISYKTIFPKSIEEVYYETFQVIVTNPIASWHKKKRISSF